MERIAWNLWCAAQQKRAKISWICANLFCLLISQLGSDHGRSHQESQAGIQEHRFGRHRPLPFALGR
ncbi:putative transmembrane succinate dehydrogenase (Cytochrome b-556 subunit) oxidoreductase protein [Ralstonia pickettii]|nr:putative transmembrane succinate dehydrogenase (Cytochrome b-556 subunit) oxidoreductase protein [Ralstonia pickettii]